MGMCRPRLVKPRFDTGPAGPTETPMCTLEVVPARPVAPEQATQSLGVGAGGRKGYSSGRSVGGWANPYKARVAARSVCKCLTEGPVRTRLTHGDVLASLGETPFDMGPAGPPETPMCTLEVVPASPVAHEQATQSLGVGAGGRKGYSSGRSIGGWANPKKVP
jgi:hypothetical protein